MLGVNKIVWTLELLPKGGSATISKEWIDDASRQLGYERDAYIEVIKNSRPNYQFAPSPDVEGDLWVIRQ